LSATVLNALVAKARIDPDLVDIVVWGCVGRVGDQAVNISRNAVLESGWPVSPIRSGRRDCAVNGRPPQWR
jgi:acetyl-CoA acyltransferase